MIYAVYCGSYADNEGNMVQGGAIAAIFDTTFGTFGLDLLGFSTESKFPFGTTRHLEVNYLKPTPLKTCLRLEVQADLNLETGVGRATGTLLDAETNRLCA